MLSSFILQVNADDAVSKYFAQKNTRTGLLLPDGQFYLTLRANEDIHMELDGATYHTSQKCTAGGVGRNLAEGLFKLHGNVKLISKVGADQIIRNEQTIAEAPVVVFDGNISTDTMGTILELCHKYEKPAFFEPTDLLIATKPFNLPSELINQIKFMSPNIYELNAIANHFNLPKIIENTETSIDHIFENDSDLLMKIKAVTMKITNHIDNIIVTLGPRGILMASKRSNSDMKIFNNKITYNKFSGKVYNRFYGVNPLTEVVNVSGAGDSFNVGFISAMIRGYGEEICVSVGLESARTALKSSAAVPSAYFKSNHPCWTQAAINRNI